MRDWWTPRSRQGLYGQAPTRSSRNTTASSRSRASHVNGKLTLGENIGDLSGIEAAYAAYKKYTAKHGEPPVIDGLTGDQRFFIAYAQAWQDKDRDEDAERQQVITNPHSPAQVSRQRHRP